MDLISIKLKALLKIVPYTGHTHQQFVLLAIEIVQLDPSNHPNSLLISVKYLTTHWHLQWVPQYRTVQR